MMKTTRHRQPVKRRSRAIWAMGVVALAAALVVGCSSSAGSTAVHAGPGSPTTSTTAAQPAAAHGVEGPIGAVPWSQVGPGWMLATWSPAVSHRPGVAPPPGSPTPDTATTTLYLVDPAGGRYAITTFPPPGNKAGPELVDWSGDGSHALFYARYSTPPTATLVDLHTGTKTTFAVNGSPSFTRPDGKAILLSTSHNGNAALERVDLAGNHQLTYPTDQLGAAGKFSGSYLESPDGTQLVLATSTGFVLMGNDGALGRQLPSPMPGAACSPVRWWAPTVILAHCMAAFPSSASQLWQVPLDGAAPTAISALNPGHEEPGFRQDLGDGVAWQLPSGTFLQSAGPCGYTFLSRLTPDGHTTPVTVPGVAPGSSVVVVGVDGATLDLQAKVACGGGQSLLTYDPAANTTTVLLGPPINGGSVIEARPYRAETS
jgi:hypothetical protein